MASINISEQDFQTLADATYEAEERGDIEAAKRLDKLARKANAALTNAHLSGEVRRMADPTGKAQMKWTDVPSLLGVVHNAGIERR